MAEAVPVEIQEGSASKHTIDARNEAGEVVVPESISYRLVTGTGVVLIPSTSLPADTTVFYVDGSFNLYTEARGKKRYLAITILHGGGKQMTMETYYKIKDLKAV